MARVDMLAMHWRPMSVVVAATVFAAAACGTGDDASDTAGADTGAVTSAGGDVASAPSPAIVMGFLTTVNRGEIEAGKLAQDKATNARVKEYARMMVTDHERALKEAGSGGGDTAATATPVGQPAVDVQAKHDQTMNTLRTTAKGRAFDSTYIAMMVAGHQDVLARLEGMRGTGNSATATPATGSTGATATTPGATTPAGGSSATPAGTRPATGNPGAVGSPGTTQAAGSANTDPMHTHVQNSIDMVRTHLERAQEIQRSLQSGS
jgi:putative membrane protein